MLLKDKKACILRELNLESDRAVIQLPETGGEEVLTIEALETLYVGYLFLVKQEYRGDMGFDVYLHDNKTHWLVQTLKTPRPFIEMR